MADLMAAYRHTTRNRAEIEASRECGCCQCQQVFPADEVVAWAGLVGRGVQTALDHAASVTVSSDVTDAGCYSVKDELCVLGTQFEQDALDNVVSVTVDAETGRSWLERRR